MRDVELVYLIIRGYSAKFNAVLKSMFQSPRSVMSAFSVSSFVHRRDMINFSRLPSM